MWNAFIFILMFASPFFFFVMITVAVQFGGPWLYTILATTFEIVTYPVSLLFDKTADKKPIDPSSVSYNIQQTERPSIDNHATDKRRFPWNDAVMQKYYQANSTYPEINSRRYREARRLNLDYFTNAKYPFDYIVMGDRLVIEETRKGNALSMEEEYWVMLGYGYDGKPFGEPWGIADECFNGYQYAQSEGDFLEWGDKTLYDEFVAKGYTHKDHLRPVNYDRVAMAERALRDDFKNTQHTRLTQKWLDAYRSKRVTPAHKVASGEPAAVHTLNT